MSGSRPKNSAGGGNGSNRRHGNRSGKRVPSGTGPSAKVRLEALPEILGSTDMSQFNTPRTSPVPSIRGQGNIKVQSDTHDINTKFTSTTHSDGQATPPLIVGDTGGDSVGTTATGNTSVASKDVSPIGEQQMRAERPQSRSAALWAGPSGRQREQSGVFGRPNSTRVQINRQSGGGGDGNSIASASVVTAAGSEGSGISGTHSAGLIAERYSPAPEASNSGAAAGVLRRRGNTLEPDQLVGHFHVAAGNTSLAVHPPARLSKSSASSNTTTSTVEIEADTAPQGQLARMLISTAPETVPVANMHMPPEPSTGVLGRGRRGVSSTNDSRSVFGGRLRLSSGEHVQDGSPEDILPQQRSASAEMPSSFVPPEDAAGSYGRTSMSGSPDIMHRAMPLPTQPAALRVAKMPNTLSQADLGADNTETYTHPPLARSSESVSVVQHDQAHHQHHQRRESLHVAMQKSASALHPPSVAGLGIAGRVTTGAESGRGGMPHPGAGRGDLAFSENSSDDCDSPAVRSTGPICPWRPKRLTTGINANRTIKSSFELKWNYMAAAPNSRPLCVVAGRDGLVLINMNNDSITEGVRLSAAVRRWSMALDFKDVIWRPSDFIATGSNDGTVMIWDPERRDGSRVRCYPEVKRAVNRLAHKPDNPFLIYAAFSDVNLMCWDVRSQSNQASLRIEMPRTAQDISCNPLDSNMISAISSEGQIGLWDIRKPTMPIKQIHAHMAYNGQCLTWHPNGRFIASGASEHVIKVWDVSAASLRKPSVTPFCTIHTAAVITHRLAWRPGYDTQISSSAFSVDTRLQVWDMRNPNHSLMYHDMHHSPITGFAWVDQDTVWSISRDVNNGNETDVVQCNMQTDAVITAGLLGSTAADFGPVDFLAVATGSFTPRTDIEQPPPLPNRGKDSTGASVASEVLSKSEDAANNACSLARFQPNLPESFVDVHELESDLSFQGPTICLLAMRYRYDPDDFVKSCKTNALVALEVGMMEISKFWQFLAITFGDALPLKPKRNANKRLATAGDAALKAQKLLLETEYVGDLLSNGVGSGPRQSTATSRASSIIIPSKAATTEFFAISAADVSSDEENFTRYNSVLSPTTISRHSSTHSFTNLRINVPAGVPVSATAPAPVTAQSAVPKSHQPRHLNNGNAKPDRNFLSLSHTNLQNVSLEFKKSRVPSPLIQSISNSLSGPSSSNNFASEPATPAIRPARQQVFMNHTANPSLASIASGASHGLSKYTAGIYKRPLLANEQPCGNSSTTPMVEPYPKFVSAPSSLAQHPDSHSMHADPDPMSAEQRPSVLPPTKLELRVRRNVTKAELKLVIDSCVYYADRGDVQTAVTAALLMRNFIRLSQWTAAQDWFSSYIGMLDDHKAFAPATEVILVAPFDSIRELMAERCIVGMNCPNCRSSLGYIPDVGYAKCLECKKDVNPCVICQQPTKGRYVWCRGCGHGGHSEHMFEWFKDMQQVSCPTGCGHLCQPTTEMV
ncbi:SEA (Seh1-associated) complex subunit [Kickxella alabastrina]|uniref:SEA (Seh1-associated) complex subunit n=1 Tax=Kickxella alabastrina TaxID=61397 RepID=A0ACC1IFH6_9FUNG|nr:SEA (Seh1-associated) complex subunit [Kickxella alabastrina]